MNKSHKFTLAEIMAPPKFKLGEIEASPGFLELLPAEFNSQENVELLAIYLRRHQRGDWGVVDDEEKAANEDALKYGDEKFLSAYIIDGTTFWVVTERDRSKTTFLLPEEYRT